MKKKLVALSLIILAVAAVILVRHFILSNQDFSHDAMRTKGNPDAPIKIVEFIDFECPACARGAIVLNDYIKEHPKHLSLQLKYFPLARIHKNAIPSATYVECSGRQGKFWEFHDELLVNQSRWRSSTNADKYFQSVADKLALDKNKLNVCLEDTKVRALLDEFQAEGRSKGVKSTPTYFINDEMVVGFHKLQARLNSLIQAQ